ncbi:SHOCT domain-containing protein [Arthrobacter sp. B3I4]|uniref:SHOCT domain-containing protein n=1 Tax=Arthrobacter sp. B3I4 TaxID=3042267 RepID=UPI00358E03D7
MMRGYGQNLWWMWLWGVLLLVGIAALVLLAVRVFGGSGRGWETGPGHAGPSGQPGISGRHPGIAGGRSTARLILDERFAKGELTAEQYREYVKELGEGP